MHGAAAFHADYDMMLPRLLLFALSCALVASPLLAQSVRRCASCGQVLLDDYVEAEGRYFHSHHFRCEYCGKPIASLYVPVEGKFYHGECYQRRFTVMCVVCNKAILEAYQEDYWGNPAHAAHSTDTPACDFCGRFIVRGFVANSVEMPDGRRLCGLCAPTSVTTLDEARELMSTTAAALRKHGIRVATDDIPVLLLPRDRMQMLSHDAEQNVKGFTDYVIAPQADGKWKAETFNIDLLYGMPEIETTYALAHELMHVWLARRGVGRDDQDQALVEGSCSYASFLVMSDLDTRESEFVAHRIQSEPDSVYGGGFRRVKGYVDANGVEAWLKALASGATITAPGK